MSAGMVIFIVLKWALMVAAGLTLTIIALAVILPPLTRSFTDRWGATDAEVERVLPGDGLVPNPGSNATKAVTIEAPSDVVFSLVAQMGYKRAGWYGWDWFYDATGSSDFVDGHYSRRIVPELQDLGLGDRIYINKIVSYEVVELERPRAPGQPGRLVLFEAMGPGGTSLGATGYSEEATLMSWAWVIEPVDAETTRLILRIRAGGGSQGAFLDWLYQNPLDLGGAIMGYKTLVGLERTAESL